ncbi:FxDxF family PEP-CTERM protein [Actimicrobium antarcticum]|uniref:FxDxF family PEP-CTERM protein n=1 Tax=Actimicrobium antarcticum TaxID=1051899 RepID=UPI0031E00767
MKIKRVFAAVAFSAVSTLSFAAIDTAPVQNVTLVSSGTVAGVTTFTGFFGGIHGGLNAMFNDTFNFGSFLPGGNANSIVSASFSSTASNGITFTSAALNSTPLSIFTVPGVFSSAYTGSENFSGPLQMTLSGTAVGIDNSYGGQITVRSSGEYIPIPAVPEPETYAMMLAGLCLLGFAARRKESADHF